MLAYIIAKEEAYGICETEYLSSLLFQITNANLASQADRQK
jgi:hypothetical protein